MKQKLQRERRWNGFLPQLKQKSNSGSSKRRSEIIFEIIEVDLAENVRFLYLRGRFEGGFISIELDESRWSFKGPSRDFMDLDKRLDFSTLWFFDTEA